MLLFLKINFIISIFCFSPTESCTIFFSGFTDKENISEYLSLVMKLIFAFGICFELPVLLLLLTKSGIMTPQDLANKRKYAILILD